MVLKERVRGSGWHRATGEEKKKEKEEDNTRRPPNPAEKCSKTKAELELGWSDTAFGKETVGSANL